MAGSDENGSEAPQAGDSCDPGDDVALAELPTDLDCDLVTETVIARGDRCFQEDTYQPVRPAGDHLACADDLRPA